ncbi:MAG: hypothetical protein QNI84_10375 [Henriciella sp.]|nr:hypothetical protein [Henriciella sp.]
MRSALWGGFWAAALLSGCSAPDPAPVEITELAWLIGSADAPHKLTTEPAACLSTRSGDVMLGELLFNSPFLLGGQAAKAGLHCGACHQNGRDNPDFVFPGVSSTAGMADVTHGLFGPKREDGTFNPVPIPDLASEQGRILVDRSEPGALEHFLRAQIVEEFEGTPPSDKVVDAVASYIRALDDRFCPEPARVAKTWRDETRRIEAGLNALSAHLGIDEPTAKAIRGAMRAALGRLHARFALPQHAEIQTALRALSASIADRSDSATLRTQMTNLMAQLNAETHASYYDEATLRAALDTQRR